MTLQRVALDFPCTQCGAARGVDCVRVHKVWSPHIAGELIDVTAKVEPHRCREIARRKWNKWHKGLTTENRRTLADA